MRALILSVFLVGCGLPPAEYRYKSGCLQEIESELELDQEALDFNVELAQRYFVESKALYSREAFCGAFGTIKIHVHDRDLVEPNVLGRYDIFKGIMLTKSMVGLFHELLHALDGSRCQLGTIWHQDWDTNRRNEYDFSYGNKIKRVYPQYHAASTPD